jgi:hypothetical protein
MKFPKNDLMVNRNTWWTFLKMWGPDEVENYIWVSPSGWENGDEKNLPKFGTFTIILIWTNVIVSYNMQWYPYNLSSSTGEKKQRPEKTSTYHSTMDGLWTENTTSFYSHPKANLTMVVNYVLNINHPHASTYLLATKCLTYMHTYN